MDERAREFIEKSTLAFIASRNGAGDLDISPRGGQPGVVRLLPDGTILLPDHAGNRRLDTLGNVLVRPEVALLFLNRRTNAYVRVRASARISSSPRDIACFPADENPPLSVLVLSPDGWDLASSEAFGDAGFWIDPANRKPALDLGGIYGEDIRWQARSGRLPVLRDASGEAALDRSGLRNLYGSPSDAVRTKVYRHAGPRFSTFIRNAGFVVLAGVNEDDAIDIALVGGAPLEADRSGEGTFSLDVPPGQVEAVASLRDGPCALIAAEPGRCETIRLNGGLERTTGDPQRGMRLRIIPDEIFFHCSAAFSRSRVWSGGARTPWTGLRRFRCVDRRPESHEVVSFALEPTDKAPLGPIAPGRYVTVAFPADTVSPPRRRCYSVSAVLDERTVRISLKRAGNDGLSALLHDNLKPNDEVLLGAPGGRFVLDSAPSRDVVLVGAGVGITPLLPMARSLAEEGGDRNVWFVHAARNGRSHLFADEVATFAERAGPRFRIVSVYSQPDEDDVCQHRGRVDAAMLASLVPLDRVDVYVCGPDGLMRGLERELPQLGLDPSSFRMEAFEPAGLRIADHPTGDGVVDADFTVEFARSRRRALWDVKAGSLLDLALAAGIDVQYSCRSGECQSCVQKVVSGNVDYPEGEDPFLAPGQVLLCQATPRGNIVLDC